MSSAKEHEEKNNGQVEILSVVLAQVNKMIGLKRERIYEYRYNVDILEKLIDEDMQMVSFLEKMIKAKKDPSLIDQLERLEKQINTIAENGCKSQEQE